MIDQSDPLVRIAAALERLVPSAVPTPDWGSAPAFVWDLSGARSVARIVAPPLSLLRGIDAQKDLVVTNVERLAAGLAAHDVLLWCARGMGKSALLRSAVAEVQRAGHGSLALVQLAPDALNTITTLFAELAGHSRRFLVFIDDLGFEDGDESGPRHLRSWLEGGISARPDNVRIAVTSNRRAIVSRHLAEQDDPINPRDAVDDRLALADRFGLSIGFHNCSQDDYLAIIAGYAEEYRLEWTASDALEWSKRRGARSGRIAWHYITEIAGRAGKQL